MQKLDISDTFEDFIPINASKPGINQENSLYYYAIDNLTKNPFTKYVCIDSRTATRDVVYCEIPINPNNDAKDAQTTADSEAVFPGFKLVTGKSKNKPHLSIDKKTFYTLTDTFPDKQSQHSIAHGTLTFESKTKRLTAHAHYNQNGQLIQIIVKCCNIHSSSQQETHKWQVTLEQTQQDEIRELTTPCQSFLLELIRAKKTDLLTLHGEAEELNAKLVRANIESKRNDVLNLASKMQDITSKISRYDDLIKDGRTQFLKKFIENMLNQSQPSPSIPHSLSDIENNPNTTTEVIIAAPKKTKKHVNKNQKPKDPEETQKLSSLDNLISDMIKTSPLSATYIKKWDELEKLALWLDFMGSAAAQKILNSQRQKLPIKPELFDYFKQCVDERDYEKIQILYPIVIQHKDLTDLYIDFCNTIHGVFCTSKDKLTSEEIQIADFFYENSSIYQSLVHTMHMIHEYVEDLDLTLSPLMFFYLNEDFEGFKMMLRQGVPLNEPHMMQQGSTKLCCYDAIQSMIICYNNVFPNSARIEYMRLALEYKGNIDSYITSTMSSTFATEKEIRKVMGNDYAYSQQFFYETNQPSTSPNINETFDQYTKIKNNLMLVIAVFNGNCPELIAALLPYASLEHTLLALNQVLDSKHFIHEYIPNTASSTIACFESHALRQSETRLNTPSEGTRSYLLFYPHNGIELEQKKAVQSARILIESLVNKYSPRVEWSYLLTKFANASKGNIDILKNYNMEYLIAAELTYYLMPNPTISDHQAMLQIFALMAKVRSKKKEKEASIVQYQRAFSLFNRLPEEDREKLENTPILKFIRKKHEDNPSDYKKTNESHHASVH